MEKEEQIKQLAIDIWAELKRDYLGEELDDSEISPEEGSKEGFIKEFVEIALAGNPVYIYVQRDDNLLEIDHLNEEEVKECFENNWVEESWSDNEIVKELGLKVYCGYDI